jgi:hypothetical protein
MYILKERLHSFLTAIGREYRRDRRHGTILAATRPVFASVKSSLSNVVETRGRHVHVKRFSDKDLDRLGLLIMFANPVTSISDELAEATKPYFESEYRRIRKKWRSQVQKNNEELEKLMDVYGEALLKVCFRDGTDTLSYPSNLRAA